ncbi:GTPase [Pseudostreptobacillus hongkongensis]|uniref:GTPase n=1 Tax=Pseudostreptobacillus hongkongensis TaxID=1162717 RepID=UPI000A737241|nr:GTPase [Pseudostreptobacillus hongkongensis]
MEKKCKGCGVKLQSQNPNLEGYIPENKINTPNIICKRCFRLKHYGENLEKEEDKELYQIEVKKAINEADIILPIFDIIDFESSFTNEIIDLLEDKTFIPIINKIDLLPSYIHVAEISKWVTYNMTENNLFPVDIAYVSAEKKYGINGIFRKIQYVAKNILKKSLDSNIKIAVIGVSNVGKSRIINLLLDKNVSTVSKFSGTTKKNTKNVKQTKEYRLTIIDTPGLIPEGRLSDLLNSNLSYKLVPSKEISRKTYRLKEKQVFMLSNLAYFEVLSIPEDKNTAIVSVYSSKEVKFHLTNLEKAKELWNNNDFFKFLDEENFEKYNKNEFDEETFEIEDLEDLVIAGLGYIEVKRGPIKLKLYKPKNAKAVVRKSISKNADFDDEEDFEDGDLMW